MVLFHQLPPLSITKLPYLSQMFAYWPPGNAHPLLLASPLRCALSLGDLPAEPFLGPSAAIAGPSNANVFMTAHSLPIPGTSKDATAIGTQTRMAGFSTVIPHLTVLPFQHRSVGTQTEGPAPREWLYGMAEENNNDPALDLLCADIARCLLRCADRWAAKHGRAAAAQKTDEKSSWFGWLRTKLFG